MVMWLFILLNHPIASMYNNFYVQQPDTRWREGQGEGIKGCHRESTEFANDDYCSERLKSWPVFSDAFASHNIYFTRPQR